MTVHHFDVGALTATPWKNGAGSTREVVSWPADSFIGDFDWRASVATVASSGPFSFNPGVDRTIVLLEGDGIRLRSKEAHVDHRVDDQLEPFTFPGDVDLYAKVLGGPSAIFNLKVRRGRLQAVVEVITSATRLPHAPHGLLLAFSGTWRLDVGVGEVHCPAQQGLWWAGAHQEVIATPDRAGSGSILLAVRLDTSLPVPANSSAHSFAPTSFQPL